MKKTALFGCVSLFATSSVSFAQEPSVALLVETRAENPECLNENSARSQVPLGEVLSGWLKSQPKFTTLFAVHFASDESTPVVPCATTRVTEEIQKVGDNLNIPRVTKPMMFSTGFPAGLGKIVDEVISCGHRICNGKQCVDVSDDAVKGNDCTSKDSIENPAEDEQPILMVPVAPPAPPAVFVAEAGSRSNDPLADMLLNDNTLGQRDVPVPVGVLVRLMMDRSALATRLEMSEQIAMERATAMEQILALSDKNARLATQLAIAEVRQQFTDNLVASMADRAENAIKLSATSTASPSESVESDSLTPAMKAVQEDLSNIRKQMSLLRRTQPVPFAASSVGLPARPYVPTAQVVVPPVSVHSSESESSEKPQSTVK